MEELKKAIDEALEKSMPKQVGEHLQKRLQEAEYFEKKCLELEKTVTNRDNVIRLHEERLAEYKKLDERNATLELREKAVAEKERNMKIETLEYQLAAEKEKTVHAREVNSGLVRNIEYRKDSFSSNSEQGRWQWDPNLNKDVWVKEGNNNTSSKNDTTTAH